MKKILLVLALLTPLFAQTSWSDEPKNRYEHIALHTFISALSADIALQYGFTKSQAWWVGFGTSAIIGVGKEFYDTNFDWNDVYANSIGGVIGSSTIIYIKF